MAPKCWLKNMGPLPSIHLRDGKVTVVGRFPATQIKSLHCSRFQMEVEADFKQKIVWVKQVGPNDSGVNYEVIGQSNRCFARNKEIINVVLHDNRLSYLVEFEDGEVDANNN